MLAAGTAAGEALLADRRLQIGRLQHDEEMCDLRAALAEAKAELQRERARAENLDNQLQLVTHKSDDRRQVSASRPTEASDGTMAQSSALMAHAPPALATAPCAAADTSATSAIPHAHSLELSPRGLIDELQRARLEAVSGTGGAALKALVSRALEALSRDLYSGAGAVLAELIQNADDARYPLDALPTLRISLTHGGGPSRPLGLMVEANECGFSEADVRAICDLGASAKVRDGEAAATGRKGLGFKSVRAKPNDAKNAPAATDANPTRAGPRLPCQNRRSSPCATRPFCARRAIRGASTLTASTASSALSCPYGSSLARWRMQCHPRRRTM